MRPGPARRAMLGFGDLDGWAGDDHAGALEVFRSTCDLMAGPGWAWAAGLARDVRPGAARDFFERAFRPVLVEDGGPALFTGYHEPELDGDLRASARCPVPLYALPPDRPAETPWLSRTEIEAGALAGQGHEIAWLSDPVDAFFLQIQGSGRVRLPEGRVLRLGYAGGNGHPYVSIGRLLIARGALPADRASAEEVKDWLRAHPGERADVMRANGSFVFFRVLEGLPPGAGPLGTLGRPVTAGRTLAVDPAHVPLGAPVWIETDGAEPWRRLMVAQDTGSAIKGARRADIFVGTGPEAGARAGRIRDGGRMVVLWPREAGPT
ncbi:murein transglycosylase A [Rubellimicrobium aerolatum]|uniref:peptidoglycan lytic exotransglycosylase n=1 Tax=Rubellimicrobium aerolatum TaxID=490979 RepID=A0ABW0S9Z1_9RHOB|nr:MltA domain-containing protein [Rubellimicrobium aerolatum]MBP1805140.1 membrane-bound lytic murein transglycosylase A [Rubellimicrobium aerolatum]